MVGRVLETRIKEMAPGVNQRGLRDYNERLLLTVLLRHGPTAGSDLARITGLSPQTVSIILRKLENDQLVSRGERIKPAKGRVGKPSVPMQLSPDGVFSIGMKIGRKSAEVMLLDLVGHQRSHAEIKYDYPLPDQVFGFLEDHTSRFTAGLGSELQQRICGIGIATPFELWKWNNLTGDAASQFTRWKDVNFESEVSRFSALPVCVVNDATAACRAEHLYGRGTELNDYAYFFIGSFIGGGIVLGDRVYEGQQGNAGALGSMRTTGPQGESRQLIDVASLHLLETRLAEAGLDPKILWKSPQDWSGLSRYVEPWIGETAQELAKAALSVCSVIDFSTILIDGSFPAYVREELVERIKRYLVNQDVRGLIPPRIEAGTIGENARAMGAASSPIFSQFFLNTSIGQSGS